MTENNLGGGGGGSSRAEFESAINVQAACLTFLSKARQSHSFAVVICIGETGRSALPRWH